MGEKKEGKKGEKVRRGKATREENMSKDDEGIRRYG